HRSLGLGLRPQLAPEIEVDADARPGLFRRLDGFARARRRRRAERRRNARAVKPFRVLQYVCPRDLPGLQRADRRMGAVVNDRRGTLTRAGLGEVDAEALASTQDVIDAHAFGPQRLQRA